MARLTALTAASAAAAAAALLACGIAGEFSAFTAVAPPRSAAGFESALSHQQQRWSIASSRGATAEAVLGFRVGVAAALVTLAAATALRRATRIAMQSQGQGGRNNLGQFFMPKVKGAKKSSLFRPRKNFGSHGARKLPRRYELYDILEEIDENVPTYTVLSEPEEPMQPVMDVPLMKRYPWAGQMKVPEAKKELEDNPETALEPLFQSWTDAPPPLSRRQLYIERRGWPTYHYPPWINRPEAGKGHSIPGNLDWSKDRRPEFSQLSEKQQARMELKESQMSAAMDDVIDEMDGALDAME